MGAQTDLTPTYFRASVGGQTANLFNLNGQRTQNEEFAALEMSDGPFANIPVLSWLRTVGGRFGRAIEHPFDFSVHRTASHYLFVGHNFGRNSFLGAFLGGEVSGTTSHPDIHFRLQSRFGGGDQRFYDVKYHRSEDLLRNSSHGIVALHDFQGEFGFDLIETSQFSLRIMAEAHSATGIWVDTDNGSTALINNSGLGIGFVGVF